MLKCLLHTMDGPQGSLAFCIYKTLQCGYQDWDFYHNFVCTCEQDLAYVQYSEEVANQTKWVEDYLGDSKIQWERIRSVVYMQALDIAAGFPDVSKFLVTYGFQEYICSILSDYSYKGLDGLYFEIWKRVANGKCGYQDWDFYHNFVCTCEQDLAYVQYSEEVANQTKWVEDYLGDSKIQWERIRSVVYMQALDIAAGFPDVSKFLVTYGFQEYICSILSDYSYKGLDGLYFEIWKRVANGKCGYQDWDFYHNFVCTCEQDLAYVQYSEEVANQTKWVEDYLGDSKIQWERIRSVVYMQALDIAAGFPDVSKFLVTYGFQEYICSILSDYSYKGLDGLYFEIWKRVANGKMSSEEVLSEIHRKDMFPLRSSDIKRELENAPYRFPIKDYYDAHVAGIDRMAADDKTRQLIREAVVKIVSSLKHKFYLDYARKKLDIARDIDLIPKGRRGSESLS